MNYAREYQPVTRQQTVLEPLKDSIVLLRAKGASYETISEILCSKDVAASPGTVRNFCRRHETDIKRIHSELQAAPHAPVTNLPPSSPVSSYTPSKPRSMRGPV